MSERHGGARGQHGGQHETGGHAAPESDPTAARRAAEAQRAATAASQFEAAAARIRIEERRLHQVHTDLARSIRHRVWQGPASERFEASIERRLTEVTEQREYLHELARALDQAAEAERDAHRHATRHHTGGHAHTGGATGLSGGGEG